MKKIFTKDNIMQFHEQFLSGIGTILLILFAAGNLFGTTFTCQTPTAGGIFTIGVKSLTESCEGIKVNIPAGKTAAEKAALIAAKINASCAGVFQATANGADVTVTNTVHPNQRVFFKFGPDATGEKDKIEKSLEPDWWDSLWGDTSPVYTCVNPASGTSVDGVTPGKVYIGTSTHVATVLTFPGMMPFDILNNARIQLMENGVTGVQLAEVSTGVWGLSFNVSPADTFVEFGDNDTGVDCVFEMFEPPIPTFSQLNFDYDGTITPNSEWGALDLNFIGVDNIMYLNLTVDTSWAIENMPVLSTRGTGAMQTQRFWFDIGDPGIPVGLLTYSLTLTPTISGKPFYLSTVPVASDWVRIRSGFSGGPPGGGGPAPAGKQKGGQAVNPAPKLHKNFPNQDSPPNFCVPTGVSNSLQWLNNQNNLGMKPGDISINSLANAFGTTPANGTVRNTIYGNKKSYCKAKKLPITTRKFSGSRIADVAKEIQNGQDVELMVSWTGQGGKGHCVAVTGITDNGNGKYSLVITHDKDQTQAGGTVDEDATYDKNTKKWGGALSKASGQSNDIMYLVECPVVKIKQTSNNLPGGNSYRMVSDARITFDNEKYQITNLELSGYNNSNIPPPLFGQTIFSVNAMANLDMSADTGASSQHYTAFCQMLMRVFHSKDSAGVQYYDTEMLQMSLQGGTLPPNIMLRERQEPDKISTGLLTIRDVPGGYQMDSFFDVWYELSVTGFSGPFFPDDNETNVLYANGPTVLPIISLHGIIVGNTETVCYDATQTIHVAGEGPFVVPPGGHVTMIAGQSIFFHDGTIVLPGGYLLGMITENGQYCPDPPTPFSTQVASSGDYDPVQEVGSTPYIRVYPNPARETVTVELTVNDPTGISAIDIFDSRGTCVQGQVMKGERKIELSLSGLKAGVYFIHVITGKHAETLKLMRLQ